VIVTAFSIALFWASSEHMPEPTAKKCPGARCENPLPSGNVFCERCWSHVPPKIRRLVAFTWSADAPNNQTHRRAIEAAARCLERRADREKLD